MARPRAENSAKRRRHVGVRVTDREHAALSAAAAAGGVNVSELMRVAALQWAGDPGAASTSTNPAGDADAGANDAAAEAVLLRREIRRLGSNVNQLVKIANAGGDVELRESVDQLRVAVETAMAWRPS